MKVMILTFNSSSRSLTLRKNLQRVKAGSASMRKQSNKHGNGDRIRAAPPPLPGSYVLLFTNLVEDLDIRPEILFSSAQSLFALLKGRANKDQNFLFVFHYSHSA